MLQPVSRSLLRALSPRSKFGAGSNLTPGSLGLSKDRIMAKEPGGKAKVTSGFVSTGSTN